MSSSLSKEKELDLLNSNIQDVQTFEEQKLSH
jgi:hypothetical protein